MAGLTAGEVARRAGCDEEYVRRLADAGVLSAREEPLRATDVQRVRFTAGLEDAGIPAFVFGENLLGAAGELPLFGVLRVCVPDPCLADAEAALQAAGLQGDGLSAAGEDPISPDEPGFQPA